jgi:hypothetical protein
MSPSNNGKLARITTALKADASTDVREVASWRPSRERLQNRLRRLRLLGDAA